MPTAVEITRLAASTHALRPDWDYQALVTHLTNHHRDVAYTDLAVMLARAATDPDVQTPAAIRGPGPWRDAVKQASKATTYTPAAHCTDHPGRPLLRCPECAAADTHRRAKAREGASRARRAIARRRHVARVIAGWKDHP